MVRGREARDYRWAGVVLVLLISVRQGAGQLQECTTLSPRLASCVPYVLLGNYTQLGADCCDPLRAIVEERPDCVCTLQKLTSSLPSINATRAYELSTLCNIISNATLSSCNGTSTSAPPPSTSAPTANDKNGAFKLHRASALNVVLMGLVVLAYFL